MPDMYPAGEYDVAGFAVGAAERHLSLPKLDRIQAGDVVLGLPSTGLHSNGFSLVRKIMRRTGSKYTDTAPFSKSQNAFGEKNRYLNEINFITT